MDIKDKIKKFDKKTAIKFIYLIIAIFLMGFSQALLSYTHTIGMAPIDSLTQSLAYFSTLTYPQFNFIVVTILVISSICVSKKEKRLLAATSFITGYSLAFVVAIFSKYVIFYFPGLTIDSDGNGTIEKGQLLFGFMWFFVGYFCLVLSISIWINVNFGLRPYDGFLISFQERFPKKSYIFYRNMFDLSFAILSIVFSSLSLLTNNGSDPTWFDRNNVGPGTIMFIGFTGYLTHNLKNFLSKYI